MLCPYCRTRYTLEQPCFCQPPLTTRVAEPGKAPRPQKVSEEPTLSWNASHGNRLDWEPGYPRNG